MTRNEIDGFFERMQPTDICYFLDPASGKAHFQLRQEMESEAFKAWWRA
ncbi:MAG: hypothetical protein ABJX32_04745 [Tateyamaria sp.]